MTLTASCTINPETILSGQSIRVFDNSTSSGEVIKGWQIYVNEAKAWTPSAPSTNVYVADASTNFAVGDVVLHGPGQPAGFLTETTYYVVYVQPTYIRLSTTKSIADIVTYTSNGTTPNLYKGCNGIPYPTINPYPVASPVSRNVRIYVFGSTTASAYADFSFYTQVTPSTKPTKTDMYDKISIFVYSASTATIINRRWTPNQGFVYSDLTFTNSLNKAGTASFSVTGKGTQTAAEETLMLSDTKVAIIMGDSVVWSGKILRSVQSKMALFSSTSTAKQWDIECESDISKMRLQNVKTANIGFQSGSIGSIISKVVENNLAADINWNGTTNDLALRSNEGPSITYNITDSDMFTHLTTLRGVIDFDMRTRLVYQRYHYNSYTTTQAVVSSISPYLADAFIGKWVLFTAQSTAGITSYFLCGDNSTTAIISTPNAIVNNTLPAATGTILILGNPVLDLVSDVSQMSTQATFRGNAPLSSTYSSGYEFDDKTDRKLLATKVAAKGKTVGGETITATIAAVTPWDQGTTTFENSTVITFRTEGLIIAGIDDTSGGLGCTLHLEGWDYIMEVGDYLSLLNYGIYQIPSTSTTVVSAVETYYNNRRVTDVVIGYSLYGAYDGGTAFVIKAAEASIPGGDCYSCFYVKDPVTLGYTAGMHIHAFGEDIHTSDLVLDPVYGYRIRYIVSGLAEHRDKNSLTTSAHGVGSIIWKGTSYSETSPSATSPVGYHGVIVQTYNADQDATLTLLEMYATMYLIAYSYYYRKASFWSLVYDFYKTDSREQYQLTGASPLSVGDRIAFLPKYTDTATDTLYGQLKNIWQIVSYTLDANTLQVRVELGDFERNMFTLLADKTASINATIT